MPSWLATVLVCPADRGPLNHDTCAAVLTCSRCGRAFHIEGGIPVLVVREDANDVNVEEAWPHSARLARGHQEPGQGVHRSRRLASVGGRNESSGPQGPDAIRLFYDKEAGGYFASRYMGESADNVAWRARADLVLDLLGQVDGLVVDLGCGPGVLAPRLAQQAQRVVCADLSFAMVDGGRRTLGDSPNVAWMSCDMAHVPIQDGAVEALLVIGVFGLTTNPKATLAEFARVIAPGGRLLLQVPNALSLRRLLERRLPRISRHAEYEARLAQALLEPRAWKPRAIEKLLRDVGFAPTRRRYYDFRAAGLGVVSPRADAALASALHRRLSTRRTLGSASEGLIVEGRRV